MYRILVVDDNQPIIRLLQAVLLKHGYSVDIAYDGLEGLEKAKLNIPDLVITDYKMPSLDGIEFITKLKELNINIKAILITVYKEFLVNNSDNKDIVTISKPFDINFLLTNVSNLLNNY